MKNEKNVKENRKKDKKVKSRIVLIGSLIFFGILLTSCTGPTIHYNGDPVQDAKDREEAILYGP